MRIEGSCHCGAVRFHLETHTPVPYMRCYCSICRKTAGGGGYAVNIMGLADTLRVRGRRHVSVYHALKAPPGSSRRQRSMAGRHFCSHCGSHLWLWDPRWPQWVYPVAGAIDTALPRPAQQVEIMLDFAAPWAEVPEGSAHTHFPAYPDESIADWHRRQELETG